MSKDNIFHLRKGDAVAYFALYIVIPIIITYLSIADSNMSSPNAAKTAYCYLSIFISALNCIYDAANRWEKEQSRRNTKLFVIIISVTIMAIYCIAMIFRILMELTGARIDWIFLLYLVPSLIAIRDIMECFANEIAFEKFLRNSKG